MNYNKVIRSSLGEEKSDLLLKNARVVNVFTKEIIPADIAVSDGIVTGFGERPAEKTVDLQGRYVVPGFINSHVHIESSMVRPEVYAREELSHGTTTIITDPHEIANVAGVRGLEYILGAAKQSCLNYYVMLPSCVPSTPFEHAGAVLDQSELSRFKDDECVLGLAEFMNVPGVLSLDEDVIAKLRGFGDRVIDGHAPMLSGKQLDAYISAGVCTDHESLSYEEAVEKLRKGMAVIIREGSASKNLDAIVGGIVKNKTDTSFVAFCTDDKHLADVRREGTIRANIKRSIELGMDPIEAIRIATINAARIYGLKNIGAVACGYKADLVVLDSLIDVSIHSVYKDGINIDELPEKNGSGCDVGITNNINTGALPLNPFIIEPKDSYSVIGIIDGLINTRHIKMTREQVEKGLKDGTVRKIAVIERHNATGYHSAAYITGYGLSHGAIATTVAHDSHNIIILGDNDEDMLAALSELKRINGGYVICSDKEVRASLPLPLFGLISDKEADDFIPALDRVMKIAYSMGVNKNIDPFITLSFMALPVIPEIRITDCGLFDVSLCEFIK